MSDFPAFDASFREKLDCLFQWRRDVRRFRPDPLPAGLLEDLIITAATRAPSVGNSQPWRFVIVEEETRRKPIRDNFEACNADALKDYDGDRARTYAELKLSGLDIAPIQVAVFCDSQTRVGRGLGQKTMPETLKYSVVSAIQTLWLAARAHGVGLGWVSIIDPDFVKTVLELDQPGWDLIAYLCIGYPQENHDQPELIRAGWQDRLPISELVYKR